MIPFIILIVLIALIVFALTHDDVPCGNTFILRYSIDGDKVYVNTDGRLVTIETHRSGEYGTSYYLTTLGEDAPLYLSKAEAHKARKSNYISSVGNVLKAREKDIIKRTVKC
jgi:hypothetical protein